VAAGFRSIFLLFGLSAGTATPPPPPPPAPGEALDPAPGGGWRPGAEPGPDAIRSPALTAEQIARLRGWQAPPRRQVDEAGSGSEADSEVDAPAHAPHGGEGDGRQGAGRGSPTPPLTTLLATAHVDPGPDWARVLTLAVLDVQRRQAQVQAAADEEALVLMLVLLEEL
jgi:hypothetical protein